MRLCVSAVKKKGLQKKKDREEFLYEQRETLLFGRAASFERLKRTRDLKNSEADLSMRSCAPDTRNASSLLLLQAVANKNNSNKRRGDRSTMKERMY